MSIYEVVDSKEIAYILLSDFVSVSIMTRHVLERVRERGGSNILLFISLPQVAHFN